MKTEDIIFNLRRNRLVRLVYAPVAIIKRTIQSVTFPLSKDSKYLLSLKDSHLGERCFIIGNGPSLRAEDLDKLTNEYTFATNRIYYIFEKTKWRPSMYVSFDLDVIRKELENINTVDCNCRMFNLNARSIIPGDKRNHFFFLKGKYKIDRNGTGQDSVNQDISRYMSLTDNVTGVCLQLAFYMGFKEIFLIGVDHSYSNPDKTKGDDSSNYFGGMKGNIKPSFNLEATNKSYQTLSDYAKKNNIQIYNATRGGKLEIFDRFPFDDIKFQKD